MVPVQEIRISRIFGLQCQLAIRVSVDDVVCDGGRFGECEIRGGVFDEGRLSGFVSWERFEGLGGEDGVATVDDEFVGYAELFAEPDDALGLGQAHVVDCEGHVCGWLVDMREWVMEDMFVRE